MSNIEGINMLGTIRLPRNLNKLGDNLPESNYDSDKDIKKIAENDNVKKRESR
jgi:hypothetical protein